MEAHDHRGFRFESYQPADSPPDRRGLRAVRGRISLTVEGGEHELPESWQLLDVLRYEIDRLMDPKHLRHVDRLN